MKSQNIPINYPLYAIAYTATYEGMECCLIYHQQELAELYVQESGAKKHDIKAVPSAESLDNVLTQFLAAGVTHVLWNPTFHPSACAVSPIQELRRSIRASPE